MPRVHFANPSPPDSPMTELAGSTVYATGNDGELLLIKPQDSILFFNNDGEYSGTVSIKNASKEHVTYKIKTTSPDKFRVKPSSGVLAPGVNITVNVVLQQGQQLSLMSKDKFLVMSMVVPNDFSNNQQAISDFWKKTPSNSNQIEQHRLKCTLPISANGDFVKNGRIQSESDSGNTGGVTDNAMFDSKDTQINNLSTNIYKLVEQNQKIQKQLKFSLRLQFFTILFVMVISVAMMYLFKLELNDANCPNHLHQSSHQEF